jgi:hypothetical protein
MRQFNTLAQYGTYHIDTDKKKANLYHAGLTIHLQERLVHLSSLSYNELASATIDQERMMKVVAEADEKKRKRMMPGSADSGSSSGAPPKYRMVYTLLGVSYVDHTSSRIGVITHNSNRGNSSSNSRSSNNNSSSTMPLLHRHSRLPSTVGRWATLLESATPTTPPWRRFPREKKC